MRALVLISVAALSVGAWAGEPSTLQQAWETASPAENPPADQAMEPPPADQPPADSASMEQPPMDQPSADQPPMDQPSADQQTIDQPPADQAAPAADQAPAAPEGVVVEKQHQIVPANTLWDLADRFYHDPFKWPVIYKANLSTIKDPHWIYPGQIIIIPGFGTVEAVAPASEAAEPTEEPPVPESSEVAQSPAAKTSAALPTISEDLPKDSGDQALEDLSKKLPESTVGFGKPADEVIAGKHWKRDGIYDESDNEKTSTVGDTIVYRSSGKPPLAGQKLAVYRLAEKRDEGQLLEKIAVVKVVSHDGKKVTADVIEATDGLEDGDWLKIIER